MSNKSSSFFKSLRAPRTSKLRSVLALSVAAIAFQASEKAFATTRIWLDTDGLFWNNTAGWSTGVVPVATDDVLVGTHASATSNVLLNFTTNLSAINLNSLKIDATGITGNMTFSQTGSGIMNATTETIGDSTGRAFYFQNAGSNNATTLTLGNGTNGNGTYNLSGAAGVAVNVATFLIGNAGVGTLNQSGGTVNLSNFMAVGQTNTTTASNYNLSGGTLAIANGAYFALTGRGNFTQNGGNVTFAGLNGFYIGNGNALGVTNTYTLSVGSITGQSFEAIGQANAGTALFNQTGGTNTFGAGGTLYVGYGGNAGYSLSGGDLVAPIEIIGTGPGFTGSVSQSLGNNTVSSGSLSLGFNAGAIGNYSLQGGNLTLTSSNEYIGDSGNGTFTQSSGVHFLNFNSSLTLGHNVGSTGNYSLQGGSLSISIGSEIIGSAGNGNFTQNGGTNFISNSLASLDIAVGGGSTGVYNLQAGNLTATNEIVGDSGTGSFSHTGGNNTITGNLTIGNQNTGSYLLDNNASLSASTETIGAAGNGTFTQNNGTNTVSSSFLLGNFIGSLGNYTLSSGNLTLTGSANETIGNDGTANFVQNGGNNTIGGALFLAADFSAGPAHYALNGGNLTASNGEFIGYSNSANFTQNGGVNNANGGGLFVSVLFSPTNYLLSSGTINATNVIVEYIGTFTINSGLVNVSNGTLQIFNPTGAIAGGLVLFNGGTLNIAALDTTGTPSNFQWTRGTLGLTAGVTFDPAAGLHSTSAAFGSSLTLNSGMNLNVTGNEVIGGLGFFTLTMNSGSTNTISGALSVAPTGTLIQNGPSINQSFLNQGTFIYEGGAFTGQLANTGTANFILSGTLGLGINNSGTIAPLNLGVALTLGSSGLTNSGFVTLNGGGINGNITNNGLISGYGFLGTNTTSFNNTGDINQTGGNLLISSVSTITNSGNLNLASGLTLSLVGPASATNDGIINLNSGILSGALQLTNNSDGLIAGPGKLSVTTFINNGTIALTAGTLTLPAFTNNGDIELAGITVTLVGTTITNSSTGTIEGFGKISANIINNGIIEPTGGTLNISSALTNPANGTLVSDVGTKLLVSSGLNTNAGLITLTGGTFDNGGHPITNTGQITGYGTFRAGGTGLTNAANITFTGGTTTINANITNNAGKTINIKYQPAIITGNIDNFGTIKTTGTTTTYTGNLTNEAGSSYISDPSTNIFQNNLTNAGTVTGGVGDVFIFLSGTVNNSGTYNNAGTLQSADNINNSGTFIQTGPQTWSNGTIFTNSGNATLTTDTGSNSTSPLSILNTAGKLLLSTPQHLNSLNITGGNVTLPTSANPRQDTGIVLKTSSLSIAPTSTLDITNHDLILGNANLITTQNEILNGIGIGPGGAVLTSSTANAAGNLFLIPLDAAALGIPSWDNVPITDPNSIIVKFTYFGDANLDGLVDGNDFSVIAGNFHNTTPGISNIQQSWLMGDVNLDGFVDGNDFSVVAGNFGAILLTTPASTPNSPTNVPEPGSLAIFTSVALIMKTVGRGFQKRR